MASAAIAAANLDGDRLAAAAHFAVMRSSFGAVLRGAGDNPRAVARAGWSVLSMRVLVFATAGALTCLSGLALTGLTTSGDPNVAPAYTLQGVGAVILGGGSFSGGVVSPIGTVVGALTLSLAGSLLSFINVPPTWQLGAQGVILGRVRKIISDFWFNHSSSGSE